MAEETLADPTANRPWHLWVIGIVATLWNSGGAIDYTMTQTRSETYLSEFTQEQLDYFTSFPAWAEGVWALGVWGAFIGSLLLLIRSRFAVAAFGISLIGLLGTTIFQLTADMPDSLNTPFTWGFTVAIWISILLLIWYSKNMVKKGVLR